MQNLPTTNLDDGEIVLWYGRPDLDCYINFQKKGQKTIILGILAVLSILFLSGVIMNERVMLCFAIILLLAVSAFAVFCNWMNKKITAPEWHYTVTNKRVIFEGPGDTDIEVKQLTYKQIKKVYLQPKEGCVSTVVFVPTFFASNAGISFICIGDAKSVQELVTLLIA